MIVTPPLFISSRLMAAIVIEGDTGGIVNIEYAGTTRDGQHAYRWVIEGHDHTEIGQGDGPQTASDEANYTTAMETLLGFLEAGAESYRHTMSGGTSDNSDLFPPAVMEWAYMNSDELAMARGMIDPENTEEEQGWVDDEEPDDPFVDDDPELPRGTHVTVITQRGIAFWVIKASPDQVIVRMVQDDRDFTVDRDEVEALDREAFCGECGQIGCGHDGLDRSHDVDAETAAAIAFIAAHCKEAWQAGDVAFFEYHCNESHDSAHAAWWYRSHQTVTVLGESDHDGEDGSTWMERAEDGTPKCYEVRWADGFEGAVFEDELLTSTAGWERPCPPRITALRWPPANAHNCTYTRKGI